MKPITKERLTFLEESYDKNLVQKVLRRALAKNPLSDIAYVTESESNTNFKFSIDIETLPVTNQKSTGRCWIFAGLNVLREVAAKKYNVSNIEFSQNYTAFYDKYEKINYFLEAMDDFLECDHDDRTLNHLLRMGIQDGGQWDMFVNLINKYGVVIKEAMPETHSSSNSMYLNRLINIQLRKYAYTARELFKNGKQAEISALKQDTLEKLYNFLVTNLGIPPKTFNFEYVDKNKNYTLVENICPIQFYKNLGYNLDDYVSVTNAPTKDKPYNKNFTIAYLGNVVGGKEINHLNVVMPRLEELILAQLKDFEVVWFGADVAFFGDRQAGIWDDTAYDFDTAFDMDFHMTKESRLDYLQGAMNHAMVITGVNIVEGIPTKWKIQNSWGDERASKGYYLMSDSWFSEHVYQAVVHKKYLTESELKAYNSKPEVLKPWDPMGSLAK